MEATVNLSKGRLNAEKGSKVWWERSQETLKKGTGNSKPWQLFEMLCPGRQYPKQSPYLSSLSEGEWDRENGHWKCSGWNSRIQKTGGCWRFHLIVSSKVCLVSPSLPQRLNAFWKLPMKELSLKLKPLVSVVRGITPSPKPQTQAARP